MILDIVPYPLLAIHSVFEQNPGQPPVAVIWYWVGMWRPRALIVPGLLFSLIVALSDPLCHSCYIYAKIILLEDTLHDSKLIVCRGPRILRMCWLWIKHLLWSVTRQMDMPGRYTSEMDLKMDTWLCRYFSSIMYTYSKYEYICVQNGNRNYLPY